jgi:elongation factor G
MQNPPHGLIETAVEPQSKFDQEKLDNALAQMTAEDPTFTVRRDDESGQTMLGGMGERHLYLKIDTLRGAYKIKINIGAPQIAYREAIGRRVEIDHTYKREGGGSGQFAKVVIVFEPGERGSGFQFKSVCGFAPPQLISGVINALAAERDKGPLAGFPLIDTQVTLADLAYHDLDSSMMTFEIAARAAFRKLRESGAVMLLEPIMKVEVLTPAEHIGEVISHLNMRRAMIRQTESRANARWIAAEIPLVNLFGYEATLNHMTEGRASFTERYSHYDAAPQWPEPPDDLFPSAIGMRA